MVMGGELSPGAEHLTTHRRRAVGSYTWGRCLVHWCHPSKSNKEGGREGGKSEAWSVTAHRPRPGGSLGL